MLEEGAEEEAGEAVGSDVDAAAGGWLQEGVSAFWWRDMDALCAAAAAWAMMASRLSAPGVKNVSALALLK